MGGPPSCRYRPSRSGHRRAGRSAGAGGGPVGADDRGGELEGHRGEGGGGTGEVVGRGERGVGHASFLSSAEVYFTPV